MAAASNPDIHLEAPVHRFRSLVITILWVVAPASLLAAPNADNDFINDTRAYLTRLEKLGFAGVVLVEKDGKPVLSEGYGLSDREHKVKWSSRSISDIGSITKQFTAAAILLLEKQGKLSVTDPLSKHFSDVPDDKRSITLHQLLTHSSGIVDLEGEHTGDYDPIERDDFVRRIFAQPLESAPGEQYAYSNANYSILGAIIEKITGQSYEAFVHEHLFLAHGMKETGYLLPKWDAKRVAVGYGHDGPWGRGIDKPMAKDGPYWVLRANGGIFSTPEDMLRWADALLGGFALPPGSIRRLWTPYVAEGGPSSYGYGWSIQTAANGDTLIGHDGGNGYYGASLLIVPRRHIAMFMMTNVSEDLPLWSGIMESVAARMLTGEALPVIPDVIAVPASRLNEAAGTFRFDSDNTINVATDGNGLQLTPQGRDAFAMTVSTRDVNLDRCRDLSARIERIVSGITSGDFKRIYEAYEHRASMETIKSHWDDSMRDWTDKHGKLKGFDVIGTAMLREREMTLVRFNFENGHEDRAYVWDKDAEHKLLGVSGRGLAPEVNCVSVKGGGFASWDPRSGDSRPFQFETQDGKRVLRITAGNQTFIARAE
jgi:CubicO group peptidase (beta-lactamase class C family)